MPTAIKKPSIIPAAGTRPKIIEEFLGRANHGAGEVSIARMRSPADWVGTSNDRNSMNIPWSPKELCMSKRGGGGIA